jgi:hypothetical protein
MPAIRTFMRPDRDQLTEFVNMHIAAVVPGWALPVSALLAQFEPEPAQAAMGRWCPADTSHVPDSRSLAPRPLGDRSGWVLG